MKGISRGLPRNHPDRERMEQLCCLFALGELPRQEWAEFSEHLKQCPECQAQTHDFERLMVMDLSAATVVRTEQIVPEGTVFSDERELLQRIRERARAYRTHDEGLSDSIEGSAPVEAVPAWRRILPAVRATVLWAGWAAAAILAGFFIVPMHRSRPAASHAAVQQPLLPAAVQVPLPQPPPLTAQRDAGAIGEKSDEAEARYRSSEEALARLVAQNRDLSAKEKALTSDVDQARGTLVERSAELDVARRQLSEEIAARESIQEQLAETTARVEKQKTELTHLQELASNEQTRLPSATSDLSSNEAKEILGARDLHIVDVYDVDNGGHSSKVYGRVYYVNRSLLIFYAFDLSNAERNRKAVAFQAWGFRQPHSTKTESLGLFYMDNASLNRWALRISDPQLLSRIDTLFVTVEPPGGSRTPKGQRLLMASLAGPANHP
jgi:hypothetical protein